MDLFTFSIRGKDPKDVIGDVAVDASNETSGEPDPRWPYLNRWTQKSPSSPSVNPTGTEKTTKDVLPELELASPVKSSDEGISAQPSLIASLAKTISPGEAPTPSSPPSSSLKGAWTVPLNLSRSHNLTKNPTFVDVFPKSSGPLAPAKDSIPKTTHEDVIRFPWAAKMDPSSRILYRATSPEYMEDGTPKVTIPSHVLLQGLENQK